MKYNRFVANCGTKMYDQPGLEVLIDNPEFNPNVVIIDDDHIELGALWGEVVYWWNTGQELVDWLDQFAKKMKGEAYD